MRCNPSFLWDLSLCMKPISGLKENPFTLSPDPRYLYLSTQHQEALNCLIYGMKKKGSSSPPAGLGPGRRLSVAPFWPVWTE